MSNQMSHDELEKAVLDVVKKINMENAAHMEPVYSLEEILSLKNVTALRRLGKALQIRYYSTLSKPELIPPIVQKMKQADTLRNLLYALDEIEWKFFQKAAAKKRLQTDKVITDSYFISQDMGLLQCFYFEDKLWFVVPDEIRAAYRELDKTNFPENKNFCDLLNNYAIAAVSLYGVISQDDFVALFNSQNERQTSIDEMFQILLNYIYADTGYCFYDGYIVDDEFKEEDFANVPLLVAEREGKPRYTLSREEFLKYSDWDYYEVTPQLIALENQLLKFIADPDEVLDILDEIHDMCAAETGVQETFDLLLSKGVVFDSREQAEAIIQLIINVQNNTRLWVNNGHTPKELYSTQKSKVLPFPGAQTTRTQKTGRNELCPCGSGKKYKNCCGRFHD